MSTVYIFHGTGGSPEGNWFPWLKREVEALGHTAVVPEFPEPNHPDSEAWLSWFSVRHPLDHDSILVGHSLGGTFALRVLESSQAKVRASFLVATVSEEMGNDFDPLVANFLSPPFDWERIKDKGGKMHVFHANDDPYVPLSHARSLADRTKAKLTVIAGGKHLNAAADFLTFPLLLQNLAIYLR